MRNETLWFAFLITDLASLLVMFRLFGKVGLYAMILISILLCNIQVLEMVELFGMTATLGNVLYGSIFLATDILGEVYGKAEARRGVILGFAALILMTIYMQLTLLYRPAPVDFARPHLAALFSWMPRIALASATAYGISQMHDVWAFHFWKERTRGRHLWIRNNASTIVSQLIDTAIFTVIAFWGAMPARTLWEIFLTAYAIKVLVALFDTPFMYLARWMAPQARRADAMGALRSS